MTKWDAEAGKQVQFEQPQPEVLTLLELPAEAARQGYEAIEVCHFHFPSTEPAYLEQLRGSFTAAGVSFDTLLLDYGDVTSTDEARLDADTALIREWIKIASQAGAKQIRIIAGDAEPTDDAAIRRSAATLKELGDYAAELGVRVITENFRRMTSTGESCTKLLKQAGERLGIITDFGNFKSEAKYAEIASIVPRSVSVHAKAHYDSNGYPDEPEFRQCLDAVREAKFNGAMVLIYDGPGDMWAGLNRIKSIVQPYLVPQK
jgi:sugar phosphate isomerase/epimerase